MDTITPTNAAGTPTMNGAAITIDRELELLRKIEALVIERYRLRSGIAHAGVSLDQGISAASVSEQLRELLNSTQ